MQVPVVSSMLSLAQRAGDTLRTAGLQPASTFHQSRTYTWLKYSAVTAIAIATVLLSVYAIPLTLIGLSLGVARAVSIIRSFSRHDAVEVTAQKAHKLFTTLVWTALSLSAVGFGLGTLSVIGGAISLYRGLLLAPSAVTTFVALNHLALAIGFLYPISRTLYRFANTVDHHVRAYFTPDNLTQLARGTLSSLWLRSPIGQYTIDQILPVIQFVPNSIIKATFERCIPQLSDEQILSLQRSRSDLFTYSYLLEQLSPTQIEQVILPQLTSPLTLEKLSSAHDDILDWKEQLPIFEARYKAAKEDLAALENIQQDLQPIMQALAKHMQDLSTIKHLQGTLPQSRTIRHSGAQRAIEELHRIANSPSFIRAYRLLTRTMDEPPRAIETKPHLPPLREALVQLSSKITAKLAPKNEEEDLEEEAYMALSTHAGLRLSDFKTLCGQLGLPLNDSSIQAAAEKLAEMDLATLGDLYKYGVLKKGESIDREEVLRRLFLFIQGERHVVTAPSTPIVADATIATVGAAQADLVNTTASNPSSTAAVRQLTPLQVPASQPSSAPGFGRRMYRVANRVYHYALNIGLFVFQLVQQPLALAAGFGYGLVMQRQGRSSLWTHVALRMNPFRNWYISPDYLGLSVAERARDFWIRSMMARTTVQWGLIGGFFAGINYASTFNFYAQQWRSAPRIRST